MKPHTTASYGAGPVFAALASGSIFSAALALGLYCKAIPAPMPVEADAAFAVAGWLALSTIFGTIIAVIPCLIGSEVMARLGCHLPFSRLPPFWALAGMLPLGAGAIAIGPEQDSVPVIFAFLATGAACALICRRFAKWRDVVPSQERRPSFYRLEDDPRLLR